MQSLGEIVENAQRDPEANPMIRRLVVGILTSLGLSHLEASTLVDRFCEPTPASSGGLAAREQSIHKLLESRGALKLLPQAMSSRAQVLYNKLGPYIEEGNSILDLGGGSGEVAFFMFNGVTHPYPSRVTIADTLDWRNVDLPFLAVENNTIAAPDRSFDQVMVSTVFHHSEDPEKLVNEAFRVAKKRVAFIESVTQDLLLYKVGCWIDWFYNRCLHFNSNLDQKIDVPCRFMSSTCWEQLVWRLTGLEPSVSKDLGYFQHLNPEHHWLFVYDKH